MEVSGANQACQLLCGAQVNMTKGGLFGPDEHALLYPYNEVMINLGPNLEQYLPPVRMSEKFPTAAFVAGRLQQVGWDTPYGKSLVNNFRDELVRECGGEFSEVLKHFRFLAA